MSLKRLSSIFRQSSTKREPVDLMDDTIPSSRYPPPGSGPSGASLNYSDAPPSYTPVSPVASSPQYLNANFNPPVAGNNQAFGGFTPGSNNPFALAAQSSSADMLPVRPTSPMSGTSGFSRARRYGEDGEDPYDFLRDFDTYILVDDSGSMAGAPWRAVSQAIATLAPIATEKDEDGIDLAFFHARDNSGRPLNTKEFRNLTSPATVQQVFNMVRPGGQTPTGMRLDEVLKPYLKRCKAADAAGHPLPKPLNVIVLTDGESTDDGPERPLKTAVNVLDSILAPDTQLGVQFVQIGSDRAAEAELQRLDDADMGGRDIVDTVRVGKAGYNGAISKDVILKALLGAVNKKIDNMAIKHRP